MHELSVANSLVDVVMEHLIESGADRVQHVVVEIGELSGVVPAALQTAFKVAAAQEPALSTACLEIRSVPITLHCENCGGEQNAISVQSMLCAACGRPSGRVVRGRELEVVAIEVANRGV